MQTFQELWATIWTEQNRALFKAWLGTVIRTGIVTLGAWIKATGKFPFLTSAQIGAAADYAPQIAGDLIILGGLAWSAFQKYMADRKIKTALVMPPESTQADLQKVMKTSPGLIPTGEIPTAEIALAILNAPAKP